MKPTTFLVDLDGVVLHRAGYFSKRAEELYPSANHAAILDFFTNGTYKDVTLGKRDLTEALTEALPAWQTGTDVHEVLHTWFTGENTIDHAVLERIQALRASGITCVIATDHSSYRKNDVWNNLHMQEYFDGIIASSDVGATKGDAAFYTKAMELLQEKDPAKIAFTDDDPKNVEVAKALGIQAFVFEGLGSLSGL